MGLLDGKVAAITGAGNGIGRATALAFAREGAKVVVNDLGSARDGTGESHAAADAVVAEIRAAGGTALAHYASVAEPEGASSLISAAVNAFGGIDVLVNNAGILRDKALLNMDVSLFDDVVRVHLRGSFLCLQAAAQRMKDLKTHGSIINTTSVSGMLGNFGQINTSAAKAGIYGLTRTASIELQRHGIRVNAIAPVAKTRMTEDLPMFEKVETLSPEHVAPVHVFLASELSREVSGAVFAVAGARISIYKVVESTGRFKEADRGIWTPQEIADHLETIEKV